LYHPRIVHLCDVKEVALSKRLNSKAFNYIFYLFVSWFHNTILEGVEYLEFWSKKEMEEKESARGH